MQFIQVGNCLKIAKIQNNKLQSVIMTQAMGLTQVHGRMVSAVMNTACILRTRVRTLEVNAGE